MDIDLFEYNFASIKFYSWEYVDGIILKLLFQFIDIFTINDELTRLLKLIMNSSNY